MRYIIHRKLIPEQQYAAPDTLEPYVDVLSPEEYRAVCQNLLPDYLSGTGYSSPDHCQAEIFRRMIVGSLWVPEPNTLSDSGWGLRFLLDREKLILSGDPVQIQTCLEQISQYPVLEIRTPAQAFFAFIELSVKHTDERLSGYEKILESRENDLTEATRRPPDFLDRQLLQIRRQLLNLTRYYRQLSKLGDFLGDSSNELISKETRELFRSFAGRMDRLNGDAQNLREYALQIRDMYQSRIDARQNRIVQLLTMITAICMPLTLITGWYGMNFVYMPELYWKHGYKCIIFLSAVILTLEWLLFKKKKWL